MRTIIILLLLFFLVPIHTEISGQEIEYSSVEILAVHYNNERLISKGDIININSGDIITEIELEINYQGWSEYEFTPRNTKYGLLNITGIHKLTNQYFLIVDDDVHPINFYEIDEGRLPVFVGQGIHLVSLMQMGSRDGEITSVYDSVTINVGSPPLDYSFMEFNTSILIRDGSVIP